MGRAFNGATVGTNDYATSNTSTKAFIGSDGTTAYNSTSSNAAALTDAAIRRTIQRLDDNDIPMDGRFFLIPPSSRNTLMGLARYTEQAFIGNGDAIRNGEIGQLYGISQISGIKVLDWKFGAFQQNNIFVQFFFSGSLNDISHHKLVGGNPCLAQSGGQHSKDKRPEADVGDSSTGHLDISLCCSDNVIEIGCQRKHAREEQCI